MVRVVRVVVPVVVVGNVVVVFMLSGVATCKSSDSRSEHKQCLS